MAHRGARKNHSTQKPDKPSDIGVAITNQQHTLKIDRDWFRRLTRYVLESEKELHARISLAFVDNAAIHRLNVQFLQHDYPTDVLTFPLSTSGALTGEIVISTEYAIDEASNAGWDLHCEVSLYVVHGLLHLCGYNDTDEREANIMNDRQIWLLKAFQRMNGGNYGTSVSANQPPAEQRDD